VGDFGTVVKGVEVLSAQGAPSDKMTRELDMGCVSQIAIPREVA
jgi:hypothetical protein